MSGDVILLDLNFTLVENSEEKRSPFTRQIENERYRMPLIKALRLDYVIMITARPHKYRIPTLHSIEGKTGWHPDVAIFNDTGERPPEFKSRALDRIASELNFRDCIAVESNPATRAMYQARGIRAMPWDAFLLARMAAA
jgi:hypothetical protein